MLNNCGNYVLGSREVAILKSGKSCEKTLPGVGTSYLKMSSWG